MESTESDIHLDNLLEEAMGEIYDVTGDQKVSSEEDQVENAELEELEELEELDELEELEGLEELEEME